MVRRRHLGHRPFGHPTNQSVFTHTPRFRLVAFCVHGVVSLHSRHRCVRHHSHLPVESHCKKWMTNRPPSDSLERGSYDTPGSGTRTSNSMNHQSSHGQGSPHLFNVDFLYSNQSDGDLACCNQCLLFAASEARNPSRHICVTLVATQFLVS